jgi:HSP20 family protein
MANVITTRRAHEARDLWDPFRIMLELIGEPQRDPRTAESAYLPTFEVFERKDAYVFRADLPGVKLEDLDITLTENRLTIAGRREAEKREQGDRFYAYERSFGSFSRSFTLPEGVDGEHVGAELTDGVLGLVVPKRPEVQPRKISIKPQLGQKQ